MQRTFDSSTAWPTDGQKVREFRPPDPPEIDVDRESGIVTVRDRDELVEYAVKAPTRHGKPTGCGWVERIRDRRGRPVESRVRAAEVMAILRDSGREQEARAMTVETIEWLDGFGLVRTNQMAARLRLEVDAGDNLERLSVRPIQALLAERLAAGESLSDICRRGGFMMRTRGGEERADTSWFARRAGLVPEWCGHTGKRRHRRTASYRVFCQLAGALGVEPHELGV